MFQRAGEDLRSLHERWQNELDSVTMLIAPLMFQRTFLHAELKQVRKMIQRTSDLLTVEQQRILISRLRVRSGEA